MRVEGYEEDLGLVRELLFAWSKGWIGDKHRVLGVSFDDVDFTGFGRFGQGGSGFGAVFEFLDVGVVVTRDPRVGCRTRGARSSEEMV